MKRFCVVIEETLVDEFEVMAESKEEAISEAIKKYKSGEFMLCPGYLEYKQMAVVDADDEDDTVSESEWIEF